MNILEAIAWLRGEPINAPKEKIEIQGQQRDAIQLADTDDYNKLAQFEIQRAMQEKTGDDKEETSER